MKRIQELMKQALKYADEKAFLLCESENRDIESSETQAIAFEKFAELIVRDCKAIVKEVYVNTSPAERGSGLLEVNAKINQKFGVK